MDYMATAKDMLSRGGYRPFFVGAVATVTRDIVFGGSYAFLRHELVPIETAPVNHGMSNQRFLYNSLAACIATILSSPLNFIRTVHYATPPDLPAPSFSVILRQLWEQGMSKPTLLSKMTHFQHRLRIGWGTARVGFGMAFGSEFYYMCSQSLGHFHNN